MTENICEDCQDRHIKIAVGLDKLRHIDKLFIATEELRMGHDKLKLSIEQKFNNLYIALMGIFAALTTNAMMMYFKG